MSDVTEQNIEYNLARLELRIRKELEKDNNIWKTWCDHPENYIDRLYWAAFKNKQFNCMIQQGLVPIPLQGKMPCIDYWTILRTSKENWLKILVAFINAKTLYGTGKGSEADGEKDALEKEQIKRNAEKNKEPVPLPTHFRYSCFFKTLQINDPENPYIEKKRYSGFRTLGLGLLTAASNIEIDDIDTKGVSKGLESHIQMCKDADVDREKYLKSTLFVKTGSGNGAGHLYNRVPPGTSFGKVYFDRKEKEKQTGLDILCGPYQAVGPWNKHPGGGYYEINLAYDEAFPFETFGYDRIKPIPTQIMKILHKGTTNDNLPKNTKPKPKKNKDEDELTDEKKTEESLENEDDEQEYALDINLPLEGIKELTDMISPEFIQKNVYDDKLHLHFNLLKLGRTKAHLDLYYAMWNRMPSDHGGFGWHNVQSATKGYKESKHKGNGLDGILKAARKIFPKKKLKDSKKKILREEKDALVNSWLARWVPSKLEIQKYDLVYDEKYVRPLPINENCKTILLKSNCGTGKSTAIRKLMKEIQELHKGRQNPVRFIYFCNRRSYGLNTINELKKELNEFTFYSDATDFQYHSKVLVEIESLHRMEDIIDSLETGFIDIVIFDECESGLEQWTGSTMSRKLKSNTNTLARLMKITELFVFADSFLSQRTENFVIETRGKMNIFKINNTWKLVRKQVRMIRVPSKLAAIIGDRIERGENWFGTIPEKRQAEIIHQYLTDRFGDVGCLYTAKTLNKDELRNVNGIWIKYRWVIQTLTNTVGIDFNVEGHFNGCFVIANNLYCGLVRDLIQSILRVRHLKDNLIYMCIKDTPKQPLYGFTLKSIAFNIEKRQRKIENLREKINDTWTPKKLIKQYLKELEELQGEDWYQFRQKWSYLDKAGLPINIIKDDQPPKFLLDLEKYHHFEQAQTIGRYNVTLMGYLKDINCKVTYKEFDEDKPVYEKLRDFNKVHPEFDDVTNMYDMHREAGDNHIQIKKKVQELTWKVDKEGDISLTKKRDKLGKIADDWLEYQKRLTGIMKGYIKDFWTEEEEYSYEKFIFLELFYFDYDHYENIGRDIQPYINQLWKKWLKNKAFRKSTFLTLEIHNTYHSYNAAKLNGSFKGTWEDFFIHHSFVKKEYYSVLCEPIIKRTWGVNLIKFINDLVPNNESFINLLMKNGFDLTLRQHIKIKNYIEVNEKGIYADLRLAIKEKNDEGNLIISQYKINHIISFILRTYVGVKLTKLYITEKVKKQVRGKNGIRKTKNVTVHTLDGYKLSFIVHPRVLNVSHQ